ncbi:hypothetical protein VCHA53O466_320014 [Vibrio chagasii]|nr:hypothetical protein VCHA53O466_320014 [Vibrio chagasii]
MSKKSEIFINMPKDFLDQCGQFEYEILEQRDAKVSMLIDPFSPNPVPKMMKHSEKARWIVSKSLGKGFKCCGITRKITEYATKPTINQEV